MQFVCFYLYLFLVLKPFYIFQSGSIQISDIFLLLAFLTFCIFRKNNKTTIKKIVYDNWKYLLFCLMVLTINTIYFIIYSNSGFLLVTLYYFYNFLAIILFSYFLNNEKFRLCMFRIMKFNLVAQLLLYFSGFGRTLGSRYMGLFNDPNQFAYFILITFCFIYILNYSYNKRIFPYLLLSTFLIITSQSTGMLFGMLVFLVIYIWKIIKKIPTLSFKIRKKHIIFICLIILALLLVFLFTYLFYPEIFNHLINNQLINKIYNRISLKIDKAKNDSDVNLWQERGYDRIYYYPQYLLYGAGEGKFDRWELAYHQGELHATFPSILFNYGIIPFIILISWIIDKFKKLNKNLIIVYVSLFLESFTLLNCRQPLFWIIIILGNIISTEKNFGVYKNDEKNY